MHSLKIRLQEMKPAFILFYLSFMGFLCAVAAQMYLKIRFDPVICLCFTGIIFGVYTFNRFTDATEDFANDIGKFLFFQEKKIFLLLAGLSLAGSIGILLAKEKLNWLHFLLLGIGFCYSYRTIPWYSRAEGVVLLRIKEMTFVKNLAVSFLWGASVFLIPILYSSIVLSNSFEVFMLSAGLFLSTFNNTLFDDILDEAGDRIAGIKTLPTTWGQEKSYGILFTLDVLWMASVGACFAAGLIDSMHALFLALLGAYPCIYMGLHRAGRIPKSWVDLLAESDLLFFAMGLMLLSLA